MKRRNFVNVVVLFGAMAVAVMAQTPVPLLDTKPAFMQIVTNFTVQTSMVIVTNYVATTNAVAVTNYYNAQGELLQPVPPRKPRIPGLIPIPQPEAPAPDPAVVKANQMQAVRDLLTQALLVASNNVCAAGSFTRKETQQIQIPQGTTSFDAKKTQALLTAMNLTAENAAPGALSLFLKTVAQFQVDDPRAVIKGASDSATRVFLDAHKEALEPQVIALVQQSGTEFKLRDAYNNVMFKGGGLLGSVLGNRPSVDIDAHVAQGLLQAIISQLTAQEAVIRTEPAARKTPALRDAFAK